MRVAVISEHAALTELGPTMVQTLARLGEWGVETEVVDPRADPEGIGGIVVEHDLYILRSGTELALTLAGALERLGAKVVNPCPATRRTHDQVVVRRLLEAGGIPVWAGPGAPPKVITSRLLHVGGHLFGVRRAPGVDSPDQTFNEAFTITPALRGIGVGSARVLGLQLFALDVNESDGQLSVAAVDPFPEFEGLPEAPLRMADWIFSTARHSSWRRPAGPPPAGRPCTPAPPATQPVRAVVIGPGRVGCGLVGQLLRDAGCDVTLAGRGPVIRLLERDRRYVLRLVDGTSVHDDIIDGFSTVSTEDHASVVEAIAGADLVATAVGVDNLADVGRLIAAGLARSSRPTNVIAFENLLRAGTHLRDRVAEHLPAGFPLDRHGFSGAVVSRVVSRRDWPQDREASLTFVADPPAEFWLDATALRPPLADVLAAAATTHYQAQVERKLYTYSAGHAVCAYLGSLKGYRYIHTAIRDPEIRAVVRAAMVEGQRGLAAVYGSEIAGAGADLDAILGRFGNAGLADPIERVGRDPRRKLAADDRLVGAAQLAASAGLCPEALALAVAAALVFCDPIDPCCIALHQEVREQGLPAVLQSVCGLSARSDLAGLVSEEFRRLSAGWSDGNLLLSLENPSWAWGDEALSAV